MVLKTHPNMRSSVLAGLTLVLIGGCSGQFERRETLTPDAGNAMATNVVLHAEDVWPPSARKRRIDADGTFVQNAVDRFRKPVPDNTGESFSDVVVLDGDDFGASPK